MNNAVKREMPKVEVIKATKRSVRNPDIVDEGKKLRVAAYCRVSTDDEEQQNSYAKQKQYYTEHINNNPKWELVDIYADEGISGTSTKRRSEFNRMMRDAEAGKIDLILTKSISRFARNTVDTLSWIQRLRNLPNPVQVRFEKEGFESFDFGSEMILTIMSAFAQAESRSISDNVKWSIQKNFQNGKPTINLNRMLGYDMGENGEWIINEKQAAVVREIYNMYLCGVAAHRIASLLCEKGVCTINGKKWTTRAILIILRNEKYVGDLIMQKHLTIDMLSHKVVKNKDIAQKYYIKDHHAPIIRREMWEQVQDLLNKNSINAPKTKKRDKFAVLSNLKCGVCGKSFVRIKYTSKAHSLSNDQEECFFSYPVLKCSQNIGGRSKQSRLRPGEKHCESEYLQECGIIQSFMEGLYGIKEDILKNNTEAEFIKKYYSLCLERAKEDDSILYKDYTEVIEQINTTKESISEFADHQKELAEVLKGEDIFSSIISAYEDQLIELEKHKTELFQKIICSDIDHQKFGYFVDSLFALPERDISEHDLIPFDKTFYLSFIESGIVFGDTITYHTKLGVSLQTSGNTRKMADFIGYSMIAPSGKNIIISEQYEVAGSALQHRKKKTKRFFGSGD